MEMNGKWKEKKQHKKFTFSTFRIFVFSLFSGENKMWMTRKRREKWQTQMIGFLFSWFRMKFIHLDFHFSFSFLLFSFSRALFILALFKRLFLSSFSLLHFSSSIHSSCQITMNLFLFEYCENEMESNVIQLCLISFHLNHNDSFGCECIVNTISFVNIFR